MPAAEIPARRRADVERHADPLALVGVATDRHGAKVERAGPDVAREHLGVALEPAATENDRIAAKLDWAVARADRPDPGHAVLAVLDEALRRCFIDDGSAVILKALRKRLDQGKPAPTGCPARLSRSRKRHLELLEAHAEPGQPGKRRGRILGQG